MGRSLHDFLPHCLVKFKSNAKNIFNSFLTFLSTHHSCMTSRLSVVNELFLRNDLKEKGQLFWGLHIEDFQEKMVVSIISKHFHY